MILVPAPAISSDAMTTAAPTSPDEKLQALEDLFALLRARLAGGFTVARDNPGGTPQEWSVRGASGKVLLNFGMIDRTFFWTWDEGVSNHYAKARETMMRVILAELVRSGHLEGRDGRHSGESRNS